jgi:hypothetical protein
MPSTVCYWFSKPQVLYRRDADAVSPGTLQAIEELETIEEMETSEVYALLVDVCASFIGRNILGIFFFFLICRSHQSMTPAVVSVKCASNMSFGQSVCLHHFTLFALICPPATTKELGWHCETCAHQNHSKTTTCALCRRDRIELNIQKVGTLP